MKFHGVWGIVKDIGTLIFYLFCFVKLRPKIPEGGLKSFNLKKVNDFYDSKFLLNSCELFELWRLF